MRGGLLQRPLFGYPMFFVHVITFLEICLILMFKILTLETPLDQRDS